MANPAVNTAVCQCTFGAAPAPLTVTSQNTVTGCNMPVATIMDIPKPPMTFGMCSSLANPTVASATRRSDGSAHSNALRACLRCSVGAGGADCARVRKAAAEQHQQVHVQLGRSDIGDRNSGSDDKCTMMG